MWNAIWIHQNTAQKDDRLSGVKFSLVCILECLDTKNGGLLVPLLTIAFGRTWRRRSRGELCRQLAVELVEKRRVFVRHAAYNIQSCSVQEITCKSRTLASGTAFASDRRTGIPHRAKR